MRKGDPVTIYMPMVPELAFVMLACVRIGAPHSVVFAGFSAEALLERIVDVQSAYVFTTDEGKPVRPYIIALRCSNTNRHSPRLPHPTIHYLTLDNYVTWICPIILKMSHVFRSC